MKKAGLLIIGILLLSLIPFISAQNEAPGLNPGEAPLVNEVTQGQQQYEQYTTAQNKTEYLKQKWVEVLGRNAYLGPVVKVINSVFTFLSPFFRIVLGVDSNLSWAFIFAVAIWLCLFLLLNPVMSQFFNNGLFGLFSSFAIASLVGISGAIRIVVNMLSAVIINTWIAWICFAVAVILVLLMERFGKMIKAKIKKAKQKEAEQKTSEAQEVIQTQAEITKKRIEGLK